MSELSDKLRADKHDPRVMGSPEMELRWKAANEIDRLTADLERVKALCLLASIHSTDRPYRFAVHDIVNVLNGRPLEHTTEAELEMVQRLSAPPARDWGEG